MKKITLHLSAELHCRHAIAIVHLYAAQLFYVNYIPAAEKSHNLRILMCFKNSHRFKIEIECVCVVDHLGWCDGSGLHDVTRQHNSETRLNI